MKISVQRYRATGSLRNSLRKRLVSSRSIIPVLSIATLILLACLHVWQRVHVMDLVRDVTKLENENKRLTDLVRKADIEITELSCLSRIEPIATDKLGLLKTGSENVFTLAIDEDEARPEGLNEVVSSLKKIADNFPVLNESRAATSDIFESDEE
jgi:cell division protein FtsL